MPEIIFRPHPNVKIMLLAPKTFLGFLTNYPWTSSHFIQDYFSIWPFFRGVKRLAILYIIDLSSFTLPLINQPPAQTSWSMKFNFWRTILLITQTCVNIEFFEIQPIRGWNKSWNSIWHCKIYTKQFIIIKVKKFF